MVGSSPIFLKHFLYYEIYLSSFHQRFRHYVLEGPKGSPYENGWYHGIVTFPGDTLYGNSNLIPRIFNDVKYLVQQLHIHINHHRFKCLLLMGDLRYHNLLIFDRSEAEILKSKILTTMENSQPSTRLCLSMSDFHPESWNPMV